MNTWTIALSDFADFLAANGRRQRTIGTRLTWLRLFATTTPHPWTVTRRDVVAWLAHQDWEPATYRSALTSLRQFYTWAIDDGHLDANPTRGLTGPAMPTYTPHPVDEDQLNTALARPDLTHAQRLALLLGSRLGLRRGEMVALRREDLDSSGLWVTGKGGHRRLVPVTPDIRDLITGLPDGWLFPGRYPGTAMNVDALGKTVRRCLGAGPHVLRHRFATRALQGTGDISAVQKVMGHKSPRTTLVYAQVADTALAAAVQAAA